MMTLGGLIHSQVLGLPPLQIPDGLRDLRVQVLHLSVPQVRESLRFSDQAVLRPLKLLSPGGVSFSRGFLNIINLNSTAGTKHFSKKLLPDNAP